MEDVQIAKIFIFFYIRQSDVTQTEKLFERLRTIKNILEHDDLLIRQILINQFGTDVDFTEEYFENIYTVYEINSSWKDEDVALKQILQFAKVNYNVPTIIVTSSMDRLLRSSTNFESIGLLAKLKLYAIKGDVSDEEYKNIAKRGVINDTVLVSIYDSMSRKSHYNWVSITDAHITAKAESSAKSERGKGVQTTPQIIDNHDYPLPVSHMYKTKVSNNTLESKQYVEQEKTLKLKEDESDQSYFKEVINKDLVMGSNIRFHNSFASKKEGRVRTVIRKEIVEESDESDVEDGLVNVVSADSDPTVSFLTIMDYLSKKVDVNDYSTDIKVVVGKTEQNYHIGKDFVVNGKKVTHEAFRTLFEKEGNYITNQVHSKKVFTFQNSYDIYVSPSLAERYFKERWWYQLHPSVINKLINLNDVTIQVSQEMLNVLDDSLANLLKIGSYHFTSFKIAEYIYDFMNDRSTKAFFRDSSDINVYNIEVTSSVTEQLLLALVQYTSTVNKNDINRIYVLCQFYLYITGGNLERTIKEYIAAYSVQLVSIVTGENIDKIVSVIEDMIGFINEDREYEDIE